MELIQQKEIYFVLVCRSVGTLYYKPDRREKLLKRFRNDSRTKEVKSYWLTFLNVPEIANLGISKNKVPNNKNSS